MVEVALQDETDVFGAVYSIAGTLAEVGRMKPDAESMTVLRKLRIVPKMVTHIYDITVTAWSKLGLSPTNNDLIVTNFARSSRPRAVNKIPCITLIKTGPSLYRYRQV